ncbi:sn-glycerol-3-phosphate ABC transporter ATP-binding protein UgpC [Microbaculum sp. A6E488]|uniref:Sn-glycerol-3-phosphate ABC transporter ATP-binding protein UgpC n=1 Tax=Microbaculum marinisediminis TaxID=2931392 RepID=A0AAW5QXJ2_9HYPH|nr:sn-glycerol-3-phosphate ABC transporter ATP-binding protein UgpC [Microbaculum sp. A6E488]
MEIRGVSKSFGNLEVISSIDLTIENGEFCVLVGPSGCGKSTLLRMLAGLETVNRGSIHIGGNDVTHKRPGERDLAMVFQSYALYPHKTVRDNLGFSLKMHGVRKADAVSLIEQVARTLGLQELLNRYPAQLSGGQRQRVAMGRAMVRDPSVFLFDEPLSNLDAKLRVQMRAEIRDLHQRIGATTVYVTHDQIEAMTMADRIIVLNGGKIEQAGPPLELFDNPRNAFVAGFLGSPAINLIEGQATRQAQGMCVRLPDGAMLELPALSDDLDGRGVVLGIRPHHLRIDPEGAVSATVKVVEPTGVETILFTSFGGQDLVCQLPRTIRPALDETIRLSADPEDILLFDEATGERL